MRGWRQSDGETTRGSTASEQPSPVSEIRAHAETIIGPREAADVSIISVPFTNHTKTCNSEIHVYDNRDVE